jgi:hypothetical protein
MRRLIVPLVTAGVLAAPAAAALPSASAFAATCKQPSTAWIATPAGSLGGGNTLTLSPGTKVYPVGIALPGTTITFQAFNTATDTHDAPYTTVKANGNCVVNQPSQANAPIIGSGPGSWEVDAIYRPWEQDVDTRKIVVGFIDIP